MTVARDLEHNTIPLSSNKIYLDVCALSRPFDDQTQMRIRLETDAIQLILGNVRSGRLVLMMSPAHDIEIHAISDLAEREQIMAMLKEIGQPISFDAKQTRQRAEHLVAQGLGTADAAHVAFAEQAKADLVTCDDRLIRRYQRARPLIWCGTPIAFCDKENLT